MNDEQQREQRNRRVMEANERWYNSPPDDDEDVAREQELRQELREQKEEWEWECRRDDELTDPKPEVKMKPERNFFLQPLTPEEKEEIEWREWFRKDTERHWNREGCH